METYEEFINNILETRGRFACGEEYHERHHIIPKSCGGTNDEENLIDLYAHEHFEAHRLLALENPENKSLVFSWYMMSHVKKSGQERYISSAEEYEEAKISYCRAISGKGNPMYGVNRSGENNPNYGKSFSEEHRKKLSESKIGKYCGEKNPNYGNHKLAGKNHPNYGKHASEETKKKQSDKAKERFKNPENHPMARKVIRLSDLTIYGSLETAAQENNMHRETIYRKCKKYIDYMYYDEWLTQQND